MRLKIGHPEGTATQEFSFTIHNEEERDLGFWGVTRETGLTAEDLYVEIPLQNFWELTREELQNLREWLFANAVDKFKAKAWDEEARHREANEESEERRRQARAEPRQKPLRPGYVYVIETNGYYKIGKARNVDERTAFLSVITPFETRLVHSFHSQDYTKAEAALHEKYASLRVKGEWFSLTDEHLAEICALADDAI